MHKFKITTWSKHETIIEANNLPEAVHYANKKFKQWEAVQFINPKEGIEVTRKTEAYKYN